MIVIDKIQPIQCPAGHRRDCVNKRTCVFRHIGEVVGDALEATRGDLPMSSCGEDDAVDIVNRNESNQSNQSVNNVNRNGISLPSSNSTIVEGMFLANGLPGTRKRRQPLWLNEFKTTSTRTGKESSASIAAPPYPSSNPKRRPAALPSGIGFNTAANTAFNTAFQGEATSNIESNAEKLVVASQELPPLGEEVNPPPPTMIDLNPQVHDDTNNQHNANNDTADEDSCCALCKQDVKDGHKAVICDRCNIWYHKDCLFMSETDNLQLINS